MVPAWQVWLSLTAGGCYRFHLNRHSLGDRFLELRARSGAQLALNDDHYGYIAQIIFGASSSGTSCIDAGV